MGCHALGRWGHSGTGTEAQFHKVRRPWRRMLGLHGITDVVNILNSTLERDCSGKLSVLHFTTIVKTSRHLSGPSHWTARFLLLHPSSQNCFSSCSLCLFI